MVCRSWVVLLGLALLLAGCTGAPGGGDDPGQEEGPDGDTNEGEKVGVGVEQAPSLEVGDSWSYVVEGYWNVVDDLTVVVAEQDGAGTLFAVSEETQLMDEVAWDLPFLGRVDERLRPLRDEIYGGDLHGARLLDFPLEPDKSWDYWETQVTAQPANLTVLGDEMQGWRITGEDDERRLVVEYASAVGYITFFEDFNKGLGQAVWSLEITGTGSGTDWVFFERAHEVIVTEVVDPGGSSPAAPPALLDVGEEDDRVYFWGLGTEGSRGTVLPPAGGPMPWVFEGEGVPHVQTARYDAEPGEWAVTGAVGDPDGWVYLQGHALRLVGQGA